MTKNFYSILYNFYSKRENEFMSNFYTIGIIGFLLTLNTISIVHLFLAWKSIWIGKAVYLSIFLTPLLVHFFYFYSGTKSKKSEFFKSKSKISTIYKLFFFLYIILSKAFMIYTLILWASSTTR